MLGEDIVDNAFRGGDEDKLKDFNMIIWPSGGEKRAVTEEWNEIEGWIEEGLALEVGGHGVDMAWTW